MALATADTSTRTAFLGSRKWLIALGIALAPLLETVDSTIVNVALPSIQGNLSASLDEATSVITGYLTANVIIIPLTPWFAERLGRYRYLTLSIFGFVIVSVFCGLAPNISVLVLLRVLQGLFGGGLIATTQAAMRDLFPAEQANIGQAIFGVVISVGPIIGPLLGGIIIDQWSWPWIFFVNVIPGGIAGFVSLSMVERGKSFRKLPFDVAGIALLAIGLGALQYILDEGQQKDWLDSGLIRCACICAVVGVVAFTVHSLRTRSPIVDLRALRDRSVWSGSLLAAGFGTTLIGVNFILPQYLQGFAAFTPTLSGQYLLLRGVPVVLLAPAIGALLGKNVFDPRLLIAFGFAATGAGTWWLGTLTTQGSDYDSLVLPMLLAGIGSAFLIIPLMTVVIASVNEALAPKASAFVTLSIQLGGSVSSALVVVLFDHRQAFHSNVLTESVTTRHIAQAQITATPSELFAFVQTQASVLAYADILYCVAAVAFVLVPAVYFIRRPPKGKTLHVSAE